MLVVASDFTCLKSKIGNKDESLILVKIIRNINSSLNTPFYIIN
jgi:hypothetical protein